MSRQDKAWFEAAFTADYLERYAHRDQEEADQTVRTMLAIAKPDRDGVAMDLCCGAGRHVLALHAQGFKVIGLDLSADLLDAGLRAFQNATGCFGSTNEQMRCPLFVRGDKRRLPFANSSFDLVTHFFTAFGYFQNDEENLSVFGEVARVLRPGGTYLFDFLSAPAVLREFEARDEIESTEEFGDGSTVHSIKRLTGGRRRVEKQMKFFHGGKLYREVTESVRLFQPSELRRALARQNLAIQHEWGDYQANRFDEQRSGRWIALSRRAC